MTFPNNATTPWAVPLIVLGIILLLVAAALPFIAKFLGNRRKDGDNGTGGNGGSGVDEGTTALPVQPAADDAAARPTERPATQRPGIRRPGKGAEGSALRISAIAAALVTALVGGTAVAAQASPAPADGSNSPSPSASGGKGGQPVMLESQLQRILEQVASTVDAADAAKDAAKLAPRVDKMELQVRTANYKIRTAVSAYEPRMPVRATKLQSSVISTKRDWPRTVYALTQGDGNVVPQVLTLVQLSPRENYKLWGTAPLQPGTNFPSFPVPRDGTTPVAADDKTGLAYSGNEALGILGEMLTTPDSPNRSKLADGQSSPYIAGALAYQADTVKNGTSANFKFAHTPVTNQTVVLRTADGGGLVVGRLDFSFEGTPKAAGDKLVLEDDSAVFAGGKETTTGMSLNFAESVAVYIPPAGSSDPMKLVAATRGLVGASFK